jgi:hypothetical protein
MAGKKKTASATHAKTYAAMKRRGMPAGAAMKMAKKAAKKCK